MLKKIQIIAFQVFKTKILKISYYWMILAPLILMMVSLGINQYLTQEAKDKMPVIAIVGSNTVKNSLLHEHSNSYTPVSYKENNNLINLLVHDGETLDAVIKISNNFDKVSILRNSYSSKSFPESAIKSDINALKLQFEASKQNLSTDKLRKLLSTPKYSIKRTSSNKTATKETSTGFTDAQMFSSIVTIIIFVLIGNYISIISSEIGREKGGHVIESILSAVPAKIHFAGKFIGTIYLLIFQIFCYLLMFLLGKILLPIFHMNNILSLSILKNISIQYVVITMILMITSILLYVLLAALLASLVAKMEDISQVTNFASLLLLVPYGIGFAGSSMPNNTIIKTLSFLPFATQNIMPMRISMQATSYASGYVSIIISILGVILMYWLSSNVYSQHALNFDNNKLTRRIWNLINHSKG
ncbi:ABC transporter permease [Leuconostoc suionicum]|uniref:ABC transporter permease n=1 Tax=Leuconostoc suionicum TaxID=1511761 RepID=UPI0024ADAB60|nr:ABC transporter permease [Leuconostoc suionicum]MDI6552081.1 ABC transporter permease [Leuconostoc suionicum]MDI6614952.1 ABC transporter permease [Leuconostoc suionicum]